MVKVIGPCFGLDARGSMRKAITFSIRKGVNYVRGYTEPKNPKSNAQLQMREVFSYGGSNWRFGMIPGYQKESWNYYALGTTESGFNRFMRYYLNANYNNATQQKILPEVIPSPQ